AHGGLLVQPKPFLCARDSQRRRGPACVWETSARSGVRPVARVLPPPGGPQPTLEQPAIRRRWRAPPPLSPLESLAPSPSPHPSTRRRRPAEIGRASCRERGGIWEGAGA